ncbi:LysR family transcriptional regulator [Demequina sp. NBRC 110055]|uniref:LysR family transcriptional regulator n=1 Tax=Demequina sp. NBRC 110055 TaxID=1570344 RepID=UPI000A06754D|nr:LysR family transcriptional regulator [Demequina sp. NBRC 110055]
MSEPSLDELRVLLAVQDAGSLTAAAERLLVTQQAVSQRMRALERRLGLSLVERRARGTTLTTEGAVIAHAARAVFDHLEVLTQTAEELREERDAHLAVAASMTIAEYLMPQWLIADRQRATRTRIELTAVNSAAVIERVRGGQAEVGFIESPEIPARLASRTIATDHVIIVVAPDHPWAVRRMVGLEEVARTALVLREPGSGTRETLELALEARALRLAPPAAELSTTAAIRAVVMAGTGAAAVSELAVRDDLAQGTLVRVALDAPPMSRPLTALWDGARALSPAAAAFLALASDHGIGH